MYLIDSFSLSTGEGIAELPLQKMSAIDMAVSQEGIVDMLLTDLMRVERPEFGSQKKSIEGDLIHHRHEINRENVTGVKFYNQQHMICTPNKSLLNLSRTINK